MLISHKLKFLTIDIPKTGTKSLRMSLVNLGIIDIVGQPVLSSSFYQHGTANQCKKSLSNIGIKFNDYFSFSIIRNPWQRYASFFNYYKNIYQQSLTEDIYKWNPLKIQQAECCINMFQNYAHHDVLKQIILTKTSQDKYFLQNNKCIINHIGLFENITEEFSTLCDRVGISPMVKLRHENNGGHYDYKDFYTQELIDLVSQKEKYIIDNYGYQY